jgi:hypothetical protein
VTCLRRLLSTEFISIQRVEPMIVFVLYGHYVHVGEWFDRSHWACKRPHIWSILLVAETTMHPLNLKVKCTGSYKWCPFTLVIMSEDSQCAYRINLRRPSVSSGVEVIART